MPKTLAQLERERRELNKRIAEAKKKSMSRNKTTSKKKKKVSPYNIRKRFPNFSRSMDEAAKNMFG